jgi:hypothetical protein
MSKYLVTWQIEVEADSPEDAAHQAFELQRDDGTGCTTATVFTVQRFGRSKPGRKVEIDVAEGS